MNGRDYNNLNESVIGENGGLSLDKKSFSALVEI